MKDAKAGFVAPDAYTIHPAPRQATNTSIIHKYGLKLKPSNGKGGSWAYACFANAACRADSARGKFVSIGSSATSNALEHCKKLHNIAGKLLTLRVNCSRCASTEKHKCNSSGTMTVCCWCTTPQGPSRVIVLRVIQVSSCVRPGIEYIVRVFLEQHNQGGSDENQSSRISLKSAFFDALLRKPR